MQDYAAALRAACRLALDFHVHQYLMSNAVGRWSGAEKAHWHTEMCRFYVAMAFDVPLDKVRRVREAEFQAVHDRTQQLTDNLDTAIGFPLDAEPDYDRLAPMFFSEFHRLALEALGH